MLHAWSPISRGVPSYWLSSLGRCHPSLSGFMEHIGCSDRDAACWLGFGCDWSYNFNAVNASPDNPFFFFFTFKRFLVSWSTVKQKSYRPSRLLRRQNTMLYASSLGFVASYHGFPCFFFFFPLLSTTFFRFSISFFLSSFVRFHILLPFLPDRYRFSPSFLFEQHAWIPTSGHAFMMPIF